MTFSAHVDTFSAEHLPPRERWPELQFTLPGLRYPDRVNCAARLLDCHITEGRGPRSCILAPGETWTYADLFGASNRIAHVLVDDLGVVPGNRVLIRAFNSPMLAACWFAVMKAGAIAVTTMPLYRSGELEYMIGKAAVHHAVCDERLADDLRQASAGDSEFKLLTFGAGSAGDLQAHMAGKPAEFANVETAAEDVAVIGFTSGTTGKPKAAMHFHRDMLATCDTYGRYVLQAHQDDLFTGSPPLGFTFGLGGLLLFPLDAGASTLLLEKAPPEALMQAIRDYRATVVFTAPIAYRAMAEMSEKYDASSLRVCVSAGETLPLLVWQAWYERTGLSILDGIGSTEMLHIFIGSPKNSVKAGSTGQTVPGYRAEIHDEAGNAVPAGTMGRLAVKGPTGCRYLSDDRQTTYVQNGWNYPGDAYRMDDDGYFWYVARTDDMIISAGYNISGPEVEEAILRHDSVKECAVVAKPDPAHHTNIVKAYVVLREGNARDESARLQLQEFVRGRIAPYKAPREIEFVAQLPRTETGKIQRFRLREHAGSHL